MRWLQRYKLRHYVRNSVWILPVSGMVTALVLVNCLHWIEERAGWQSSLDPAAALALFGTLAGSMLTFIVFLSSSLLLVVQLASAQLTPRFIGVVFRDPVTRFALTLFAFTFTFTLALLVRIHTSVPALTAKFSGYLCLLSVGVFLFLIDHVGKSLRPSGALRAVARLGHEVIQSVYPRRLSGQQDTSQAPVNAPGGEPAGTVPNPKDGVFLAFDLEGLMALAREAECVVELVPQLGDFVAAGSPLFRIFGAKGKPSASALCQSVALGQERTMEQDPTFAFRIIVDIASKGLSPAINDPTTAVLAICREWVENSREARPWQTTSSPRWPGRRPLERTGMNMQDQTAAKATAGQPQDTTELLQRILNAVEPAKPRHHTQLPRMSYL